MTAAATVDLDRNEHPYRMKDLCELTGLPRQVIHFYIQQGLVPEGHKTGRNMAYYGTKHVQRIRLIRALQHERFLPLKAIRAMFEERDEAFSPAQWQTLVEVKHRIAAALGQPSSAEESTGVDADELLARHGILRTELDQLVEMGVLGVRREVGGATLISKDDVWMLEIWGQLRRAGFTDALGFTVADMAVYEESISALFRRESLLMAQRLGHLPPEQIATMVIAALPLIHTFLARYHETKVRNFFNAME